MTPDFDNSDYPSRPGYKRQGTSRDAAQAIAPVAPDLRTRVFRCLLRSHGMTADEVAGQLGESVLSIRPRFSELAHDGLIEATGERRRNVSGVSANVWRVTR